MSPLSNREDLLKILEANTLTPVFQPIFDLEQASHYGFEALIRGPANSALHSPVSLFQAAHQMGLLNRLEYACRDTSCRQFCELNGTGKLFINVSPMSLVEKGYRQGMTREILDRYGLSPDRIVIELSEQYPLDEYEVIKQATRHYREMGFEIAIDDLGAGYAGLRVWEEIRPDYVKIDRHFIEHIDRDLAKQEFVRSIQKIAQGLSCRVVAEGIETLEQLNTVRKLGICFGQGYYLGRPESRLDYRLPEGLVPKMKTPRKKSSAPTAADLAEQAVTIDPEEPFEGVMDLFRSNKSLACLPVLADGFAVGAVSRQEMLELMASPYTHDLFRKKRARDFMTAPLMVESYCSLEEAGKIIATQGDEDLSSHFIVVDSGRFLGVGRTRTLLGKLTEIQLQDARHANPLTQLPGNLAIDQTLEAWMSSGVAFHVAYLDLNNFKPFNDYYGYKAGDEVIIALAELAARYIDKSKDFVGHIGGDDFVVLFRSVDWEQRCRKIIEEFDAVIPLHYDERARRDGGIRGVDRRGESRFFPLLGLAVGVVNPDLAYIASYHDISALATDAKRYAKKESETLDGKSHLFVSRRRKPHRL